MTNSPTTESLANARQSAPADNGLPQPLALLLFTQRLAALMEAHVAPARACAILGDTSDAYGAVAADLANHIERGKALCDAMTAAQKEENNETWWHPTSLFAAMAQHPSHFSRLYVTLVRCGEISGAADETLRRLQSALATEWRLMAGRPQDEQTWLLSRPASRPGVQDWGELSSYQQTATLALFFEALSILLTSGLPLLPAMDSVAELLPANQAAELMQIRREIKEGAPILPLPVDRLDFIPRYAKEIAGLGVLKGCLDTALHDVARLFEEELDYKASRKG